MKKQNKTKLWKKIYFSKFMFCTNYGHYTINYCVIHVGIVSFLVAQFHLQRNGLIYEAEISYLKSFQSNV